MGTKEWLFYIVIRIKGNCIDKCHVSRAWLYDSYQAHKQSSSEKLLSNEIGPLPTRVVETLTSKTTIPNQTLVAPRWLLPNVYKNKRSIVVQLERSIPLGGVKLNNKWLANKKR